MHFVSAWFLSHLVFASGCAHICFNILYSFYQHEHLTGTSKELQLLD